MFLRHRSTQEESFDVPGQSASQIATQFGELDRINRAFHFAFVFKRTLPSWLGLERCARLDVLDLGAGTGSLGRELSAWAAKRGWQWRFTNLDANAAALKFGGATRPVAGSVLKLPFADGSFDLVTTSQMTHHLTESEVVAHWREAWRVSRDAVFVCDVHRNAGLYSLVWMGTQLLRIKQPVRDDAMISIKRGFRLRELNEMAKQAGWNGAKVWLHCGTRLVAQARKCD
jgi:ubiquinone/menaquinone biosynthesis C-methylase UbiE